MGGRHRRIKMEQMRQVMAYVVERVERMLEDERHECKVWLEDTCLLYKGTPEWDGPTVQGMYKKCEHGFRETTKALEWLRNDGIIGEYTLAMIKEDVFYEEELLSGSCSGIMDYAVVGLMRAWIFEFEHCGAHSIEFFGCGNWEAYQEDLTMTGDVE